MLHGPYITHLGSSEKEEGAGMGMEGRGLGQGERGLGLRETFSTKAHQLLNTALTVALVFSRLAD